MNLAKIWQLKFRHRWFFDVSNFFVRTKHRKIFSEKPLFLKNNYVETNRALVYSFLSFLIIYILNVIAVCRSMEAKHNIPQY
jgi:hypothetical protein